jgi:hypothetical protein
VVRPFLGTAPRKVNPKSFPHVNDFDDVHGADCAGYCQCGPGVKNPMNIEMLTEEARAI